MLKKLGSLIVISLIIIGALNVVSINKKVFKGIVTTIAKKPLGDIPGGIASNVVDHKWKFVR